jgi:hypothetical protein
MIIRDMETRDVERVRSLTELFPQRDFNRRHYVVRDVAEEKKEVVACGLLRVTSEIILILDKSKSKRIRGEAISRLLGDGIFKGQRLGLDEMHAFLLGDDAHSFAHVLKNRFGFQDVDGIPLVLEL